MITTEETLETIEHSHQAIKKLIEKGQKVERYIRETHDGGLEIYKISIFKVVKSTDNGYPTLSFNDVNMGVNILLEDPTYEQIKKLSSLSYDVFDTLKKTYELQSSEEFKFNELKKNIREILNPMELWGVGIKRHIAKGGKQ